ncbi:DUF5710 domain-containing protein [Pseudomonas eucalypticola]|uniref:DUF5710 domain-containing protein n=1 Tax=Pseudomonas eucalypticola TaxID=2599595 RepID=A0A7D5H7J3_9PSED|nr:DUF5710 domain-containing protein [Pseudomonas eucalypticola]QKZ06049.1 hypothetical protein HWQ56_20580 [Pseudomonas eucalypticola]
MATRIDLAVPYEEKDEAKKFDVEWDEENRVWWTTDEGMCEALERWLPYTPTPPDVVDSLPTFEPTVDEQVFVEQLAQDCEYEEWMLLMLPEDKWGAFWRDDLKTSAATHIAEENYDGGCRFIATSIDSVLDYMRNNLIHTGAIHKESNSLLLDGPTCYGKLTIGNRTFDIELSAFCEEMVENMSSHTPIPSQNSNLSLSIFSFIDKNTAEIFKAPLIKDLAIAEQISKSLRLPLPLEAKLNRVKCSEFIDAHKSDLTMYRAIRRELERGTWPITKLINNYVKWIVARTKLAQNIPWESIADELGVKTKATIEKYAVQADQAEIDNPELLTNPTYTSLIKIGLAGDSVDYAVSHLVDAAAWEEFAYEKQVRRALKAKNS